MGKYFKEDNSQRISKASKKIDVNMLALHSIKTAQAAPLEWLLGKLTKADRRALEKAGALVEEGGTWVIKNLGLVSKIINKGQKAETLGQSKFLQVLLELSPVKGVLGLLKYLPVKQDKRIINLLKKNYEVRVSGRGGVIETKITSLDDILKQLEATGTVSVEGKKLAPQSEAVFNEILKDINQIEAYARTNKALLLAGGAALGTGATAVVTKHSLSPEAKEAAAEENLRAANRKIFDLSKRQIKTYAQWQALEQNSSNMKTALSTMRAMGFNETEFMKQIALAKTYQDALNSLARSR